MVRWIERKGRKKGSERVKGGVNMVEIKEDPEGDEMKK